MSAFLEESDRQDRSALREAIRLLESTSGADFSSYKQDLLLMRFKQRMAMSGATDREKYLERLAESEKERSALTSDFLVGVTKFFRDPKVFEVMAEQWLPALLQRFDRPLKVWVPGCSSGQEAYSWSIVLDEITEGPDAFRIFATDVDEAALDRGVRGVFPVESIDGVSEQRRRRYFEQPSNEDGAVRVSDDLRRRVVFAEHDVIREAPLGEIHLISCKNLLIFLQDSGQEKVIENFRRALVPGGFLGLGPSEFLKWPEGFQVVDQMNRLFKREEATEQRKGGKSSLARRSLPPGFGHREDIPRQLVDRYFPQGYLISPEGRLLRCFGGAENLLRVKRRRPSDDLLDLLPVELTGHLVRAMREARLDHEQASFDGVEVTGPEGVVRLYDVVVEPLFEESRGASTSSARPAPDQDSEGTFGDQRRVDRQAREVFAFFLSFVPTVRNRSEQDVSATEDEKTRRQARSIERLGQRLTIARAERRRLAAELEDVRQSLESERGRREQAEKELEALNNAWRRISALSTD